MDCANREKILGLIAQRTGKLVRQPESSTEKRVAGSKANFSRVQQNAWQTSVALGCVVKG